VSPVKGRGRGYEASCQWGREAGARASCHGAGRQLCDGLQRGLLMRKAVEAAQRRRQVGLLKCKMGKLLVSALGRICPGKRQGETV